MQFLVWILHLKFHLVISYNICQNYLYFFSGQCVEVTYFNKSTVCKLSDMKKYLEHTVNSFAPLFFPVFNCNQFLNPLKIISNKWQVFKRIKRLIYTILCKAEIHWGSLKFFLDVVSCSRNSVWDKELQNYTGFGFSFFTTTSTTSSSTFC